MKNPYNNDDKIMACKDMNIKNRSDANLLFNFLNNPVWIIKR